jgi:hypothetical protein
MASAWLALACVSPALAADRYVSRLGSDTANACAVAASPCRSIDWATTQATNGDVIKVATGKYKDRIRLPGNANLSFSGGWSEDFTQRAPRSTPTVLKPMRTFTEGTELQVEIADPCCTPATSTVTATIDGFVIQRGRGSGTAAFSAASILADDGDAYTVAFVDVDFLRNAEGAVTISATHNSTIDVSLTRCRFLKNKYRHGGSTGPTIGVYADGLNAVDVTITDSLIARNSATAIRIDARELGEGEPQVNVRLANTTITANKRRGIRVTTSGAPANTTLELLNTIVWGNTWDLPPGFGPTDGVDLHAATDGAGGSITIDRDHSDMHDVVAGTGAVLNDLGGNVDIDPSFVRGDAYYHLDGTSPLVDAGTNTGVTATDVDGNARPYDGDGDTVAVSDIGAHEVGP